MKRAAMFIALVAVAALGMFAAVALAGGEGGYHPPTTTTNGHTPVSVCHKPGTPAQQTLTFDDDGWKAHIDHGDTPGPCGGTPPVDVCPNLEGNQATVPPGYVLGEDENGRPACVEEESPPTNPVDVCSNLEGNQASVPPGYHLVEGENGRTTCVKDEEPPTTTVDVCTNLGGDQATVPPGYKLENGVCVRVCPDGGAPTPGEGAYDPNDDCKRPPPVTTTTTTTTTPAVTTATTTTPTTTTVAPETTTTPTPETKPPTKVADKPKQPKPDDPGKLTGDKKKDKCVPSGQPGVSTCVTSTGKKVPVYEGQG